MDVRIKGKYTIEPEDSTWSSRSEFITLSELDQSVGLHHIPLIYLYNSPDQITPATGSVIDKLKDSLAKALNHYYPLAGRIRKVEAGRLELHVGGLGSEIGWGAELLEAESSSQLSDLVDEVYTSSKKLHQLMPWQDYVNTATEEIPLLVVQVTNLACGGLSIGVMISHVVTDGTGMGYFLNDWCRIARGEPLDEYPCHDRTVCGAGEPPKTKTSKTEIDKLYSLLNQPPPQAASANDDKQELPKSLALPLTKAQVDNLKNTAMASSETATRPFSRYEVLVSHIWRCVCKARGNANEEEKAVGIVIDGRSRIRPFPPKYFGNCTFFVSARSLVSDLLSKPLGFACESTRKAIERTTEEYIWSEIDLLKSLDDLSMSQLLRIMKSSTGGEGGGPVVSPNPGVISWLYLSIYGLDFGWGKEIQLSIGEPDFDGVSLILPGRQGDGSVTVLISLLGNHVDMFKKYFYEDI